MIRPTLSAHGFQEVLAALYRLSNEALHDECADLEADFGTWLTRWFKLSHAQQSYLHGMDPDTIEVIAEKLVYSLIARFPIQLVVPVGYVHRLQHRLTPALHHEQLLTLTETSTISYLPGNGFIETSCLMITLPLSIIAV